MPGLTEWLVLAVICGVGVLATLFWIWMLVDCATKESSEGKDKLVWIVIILFANLLGALIYFVVRRPVRIAESGGVQTGVSNRGV